jgi:ArsR family transcriptional regulator, arsenate/arsenite/antimonite-responsive transcriptional repressor / arsenate reductase (thioredoxin)
MQSDVLDVAPPAFLQLVGHPLRWRLLEALARTDRTVHELTRLVEQPQNLVSYHLGKLRGANLVSARRSTADRRDAYYALDLRRIGAVLSAAGGAIHPGLRLERPAAPVPASGRVLFLCTGNSARSQIAEALCRVRSSGAVDACSAGSHPKPLHPNAVQVLRESYGIDISGQESKRLDQFAGERFDSVISLCDRVREVCPEFAGPPETAHWSIPDPAAGEADDDRSYPRFEEVAAELDVRIGFLLTAISARTSGR